MGRVRRKLFMFRSSAVLAFLIIRKRLGKHATRECQDPPVRRHPLGSLRKHEKGATQVCRDHFIEGLNVSAGNGKQRHDPGCVDDGIDMSEFIERSLEEAFHLRCDCNVCLYRYSLGAPLFYFRYQFFCLSTITGVVHHEIESVGSAGWPQRKERSDP
jgi:hypothetical protein